MRCHGSLMPFQQIRDDGQHQVRRFSFYSEIIFFSCPIVIIIIKLYKNSKFQLTLCHVERKLESGLNIMKQTEVNNYYYLQFLQRGLLCCFWNYGLYLWQSFCLGCNGYLSHCKCTIISLDLKFVGKKRWGREKLSNLQLITDFLSQVMGDIHKTAMDRINFDCNILINLPLILLWRAQSSWQYCITVISWKSSLNRSIFLSICLERTVGNIFQIYRVWFRRLPCQSFKKFMHPWCLFFFLCCLWYLMFLCLF